MIYLTSQIRSVISKIFDYYSIMVDFLNFFNAGTFKVIKLYKQQKAGE